jgi:hypothetical protein
MNTPTLEQLKAEAQRRWPLDPSVQLYWINEQLRSLELLAAMTFDATTYTITKREDGYSVCDGCGGAFGPFTTIQEAKAAIFKL